MSNHAMSITVGLIDSMLCLLQCGDSSVYMSNTNSSNLYFPMALYLFLDVYDLHTIQQRSSALHQEAEPEFCNNREKSKEANKKQSNVHVHVP